MMDLTKMFLPTLVVLSAFHPNGVYIQIREQKYLHIVTSLVQKYLRINIYLVLKIIEWFIFRIFLLQCRSAYLREKYADMNSHRFKLSCYDIMDLKTENWDKLIPGSKICTEAGKYFFLSKENPF